MILLLIAIEKMSMLVVSGSLSLIFDIAEPYKQRPQRFWQTER
jgi:hypothetical protein